jgi:pentapeptide MXKDX repeat protein
MKTSDVFMSSCRSVPCPLSTKDEMTKDCLATGLMTKDHATKVCMTKDGLTAERLTKDEATKDLVR